MKKESKRGHSFFFLSGRNHFTEIFGGFVLVPAPHRLLIMIFVFSVFFPAFPAFSICSVVSLLVVTMCFPM